MGQPQEDVCLQTISKTAAVSWRRRRSKSYSPHSTLSAEGNINPFFFCVLFNFFFTKGKKDWTIASNHGRDSACLPLLKPYIHEHYALKAPLSRFQLVTVDERTGIRLKRWRLKGQTDKGTDKLVQRETRKHSRPEGITMKLQLQKLHWRTDERGILVQV